MRHRKSIRRLNRKAEHRKAVLANLAASLFEKKRITTTHAKAKATQQFAEKLITIAKADSLHARRIVLSRLRQKMIMQTLFNDVAPVYSNRNGGYTRVIRLGQRSGDGAEISVLELVGFEEAMKKRAKEKKGKEKVTEEKKADTAAPPEVESETKDEAQAETEENQSQNHEGNEPEEDASK